MSILRPSIVVGLMASLALPNATILNFGGRGLVDPAHAQDSVFESKKIVPFVPSPQFVVTKYLLPDVNLKLRPNLLSQLKPGSRIVSHSFDMGDWKPDKVERVEGRTIYFWTVPAKGN